MFLEIYNGFVTKLKLWFILRLLFLIFEKEAIMILNLGNPALEAVITYNIIDICFNTLLRDIWLNI